MASFSENRTSWKIRFYNSRRTPKEKVISLPKESWSKTDAKKRWRELEVAFDRGEYDPWSGAGYAGSGKTLMDAAEEFIAIKTAAGRRGQRGGWNEHTASRHGSIIRHMARAAGPSDPAAYLTSEQLEDFIFRADLRHESRASYRRIIGPFIGWLGASKLNTAVELPPPPKRRRRLPELCTEDDLDAICDAHGAICDEKEANRHTERGSTSRELVDIFRVYFYQGFRREELTSLRVRDVDFDRMLIRVGSDDFAPKWGKDRIVPLTEPAEATFRIWCYGKSAGDRVFERKAGRNISDAFRRARRRAFPEREALHLHRLRNACAVYWIDQGKSLLWVRDLLGHESVTMLERYLKAMGRRAEW